MQTAGILTKTGSVAEWLREAAAAFLACGHVQDEESATRSARELFTNRCVNAFRMSMDTHFIPLPHEDWPEASAAVAEAVESSDRRVADVLGVLGRVDRLAKTARDAFAPDPLRDDIQACVDAGLLTAKLEDAPAPKKHSQWRLVLTESGAQWLAAVQRHLEATGQA
jgi:hypothetical protein